MSSEADFAHCIWFKGQEPDAESLRDGFNWTGWTRRLWPATVEWPGKRVYAFDRRPGFRRFCAVLEITRGGAFEYWTKRGFSAGVKRLTKWAPLDTDPHFDRIPFPRSGDKPCIGFTVRWKLVKEVDIPQPKLRFPRIGWLRLPNRLPLDAVAVDAADLYDEGRTFLREHQARERNPKLRADARMYWRQRMGGKLACCVCGFEFEEKYKDLGTDFIEMHHEKPLSRSRGQSRSRVTDLVPVCSNCHRMLHRRREPILTTARLRRTLN